MTARARKTFYRRVTERTEAIIGLLAQHDLFDLLELVRRKELSPGLDGFKESESTSVVAAIEVAALLGLASDTVAARLAAGETRGLDSIVESAEALDAYARDILNLAVVSAPIPDSSGISELTHQLRVQEILVRNKQYKSVAESTHQKLFGPPQVRDALTHALGFNYSDLTTFRNALSDAYRTAVASMITAMQHAADHLGKPEAETATRSALAAMRHPAQHNEFTINSIVSMTGLSETVIEAILAVYAIGPASKPAATLIDELISGVDYIGGTGIITDGSGRYFILTEPIPNDILRRRIEDELKQYAKRWETYRKHRDALLENLATAHLTALLGAGPQYRSMNYYAPKAGTDPGALARNCSDPNASGALVEADALYVVGDLAICVEAKAGAITPRARSGSTVRVATDLQKTIGEASQQAHRLRNLILGNGGVWLRKGKWLDLSHIREVRTIVVCLDDFGPLAIAADALVRAELLRDTEIPWIVSLHDLEMTGRLIEDPATFLLYLRRRTDTQSVRTYSGVDELDLLMWFMAGGLYFEADPHAVYRAYPNTGKPHRRDLRAYRRRPKRAVVSTMTDELDAWMYYEEGQSATMAPKPHRRQVGITGKILHKLSTAHQPGLRAVATLMGAAEDAQLQLAHHAFEVASRTARDGRVHTAIMTFSNVEESIGYFLAAGPNKPTAGQSLRRYMAAKKHQLHLTSALGIVVDQNSSVIDTVYLNEPWEPNDALDRDVRRMGLKKVPK
ncbi:hypothetical protein AXZ95_2372 [Leifsonia sp. 115AMFTsu3.1]|nr:hypothetical protein AXZ95_2372 [Leifsonia sp. 115AMFTsu3.1]